MGWTSFLDNRELSTGQMCTREYECDNPGVVKFSVVDQSTRGSVWYGVGRIDRPNENPVFYGLVWLTSRRGGQFAYKDMTECMGPFYWDCPARLLDQLDQLAPNAPESALNWRAQCRAKLAAKRKPKPQLAPGQIVQFGAGRLFELVKPAGPRLGWFVRLANQPGSMLYRATARQISQSIQQIPL